MSWNESYDSSGKELLDLDVYFYGRQQQLILWNTSLGSKSAADLASSFLNSVGQELQGSSSGEPAYYESNGRLLFNALFCNSDS